MLLNLEVNITAGSLTSCPGRCVFYAGCDLFMRPQHGGRRRAVDALDGHRRFLVVVVVRVLLRGDGSVVVFTARRLGWCRAATAALVQHGCHGRSGSFQRCYGCYDSSASAEALRLVAPCACLLTCLAWQLHTFCMLVSNTASSAFCVGPSFVSSYLFPEGITTI